MRTLFSTRTFGLSLGFLGLILSISCSGGKPQISKNSPEYVYLQAK